MKRGCMTPHLSPISSGPPFGFNESGELSYEVTLAHANVRVIQGDWPRHPTRS